MKRLVNFYLKQWKDDPLRKPILLRGAHQVGKTDAVRELAQSFDNFIEINFEERPAAITIFDQALDLERIIRALSLLVNRPITPKIRCFF